MDLGGQAHPPTFTKAHSHEDLPVSTGMDAPVSPASLHLPKLFWGATQATKSKPRPPQQV
eukprot:1158120-Pelagomonas_calceolata.AAC.3